VGRVCCAFPPDTVTVLASCRVWEANPRQKHVLVLNGNRHSKITGVGPLTCRQMWHGSSFVYFSFPSSRCHMLLIPVVRWVNKRRVLVWDFPHLWGSHFFVTGGLICKTIRRSLAEPDDGR